MSTMQLSTRWGVGQNWVKIWPTQLLNDPKCEGPPQLYAGQSQTLLSVSLTLTNFPANAGSRSKAESRQPLSIFKDQCSSLFFIWFCFGKAHLDRMTFSARLIESRLRLVLRTLQLVLICIYAQTCILLRSCPIKKDGVMNYRILKWLRLGFSIGS